MSARWEVKGRERMQGDWGRNVMSPTVVRGKE